jgi:hypothetical protein
VVHQQACEPLVLAEDQSHQDERIEVEPAVVAHEHHATGCEEDALRSLDARPVVAEAWVDQPQEAGGAAGVYVQLKYHASIACIGPARRSLDGTRRRRYSRHVANAEHFEMTLTREMVDTIASAT